MVKKAREPRGVKPRRGRIFVAAGTNGAGKSTLVGQFLGTKNTNYFNPDVVARRFLEAGVPIDEANALAWQLGFDALRHSIDNHKDFNFETTLGGESITNELHRACEAGLEVIIIYVGLGSVEQHIERVRARVKKGGHHISEQKIRERYVQSPYHLIGFIGVAAEIHVFDNSVESADGQPISTLVMRMRGNRIIEPSVKECLLSAPDWAKPIVAAALKVQL